jgi:hypothetical protein
MVKLVATLAVAGAIAACVFLLPIRGRTVADRWSAAPDAAAFAKGAWDEGRAAVDGERSGHVARPRPLAKPAPAPASRPSGRRGVEGARPAEHLTHEDRASLDRLLTERSR